MGDDGPARRAPRGRLGAVLLAALLAFAWQGAQARQIGASPSPSPSPSPSAEARDAAGSGGSAGAGAPADAPPATPLASPAAGSDAGPDAASEGGGRLSSDMPDETAPNDAIASSTTALADLSQEVEVVYFHAPPFTVALEDGSPTGFAVEALRAAAYDADLRLRFRLVATPGDALAALRSGGAQVIPALGDSEERRDVVAFSRPIAHIRLGLYAPAARAAALDAALKAGALRGARLGVSRGSLSERAARALPGASPQPLPGVSALIRALQQGEVDAIILPEAAFRLAVAGMSEGADIRRVGDWLGAGPLSIAVDRRNPGLLARLDAALEAIQATPRFSRLETRWFGAPPSFWSLRRIAMLASAVVGLTLLISLAVILRVRERARDARLTEARRYAGEQKRLASELSAKNAELEARSKDMERLLYVVSHDLKSPLVSIGGFARRLERHVKAGEQDRAASAAERISRNAENMSNLIEGILSLGRIGSDAAEFKPVDLGETVDAVRDAMTGRLEEAGARLLAMRPLPVVRADPVQLRQALQNLVENALRYGCPEPGMTVEIVVRQGDDAIEIGVRDSGPGVPLSQQARIFDLYKRGAGGSRTRQGAGLGLATVRKIAEWHGGRVSVDSRAGAGATFWIAIPRSAPEVAGVSKPEAAQPAGARKADPSQAAERSPRVQRAAPAYRPDADASVGAPEKTAAAAPRDDAPDDPDERSAA